MRRTTGLLLTLSLLAAACGDDSETGGDASTTSATVTAAPTEPDGDTPETPVELRATDDGVTAEVIRIAAVFPDLTVVGRDNGDVAAKFEVAVDRANADGGINGRTIELVDAAIVNPIGDVAYEEACLRHTEDDKVFAVVGLFLRTTVLCYPAFHDTIAVNAFAIDEEQIAQSTAPLLAIAPLASRTVGRNLDTFIDGGHLETGMRVALHGLLSDEAQHQLYEEALEARGIAVVASTLRQVENDIQAGETENATYGAVWQSADVDAIVASTDAVLGDLIGQYERLGFEVPMLLPEGTDRPPSLIATAFGYSLDTLEHAVVLITEQEYVDQYAAGVNGVRECVDEFVAATGEEMSYEEGDEVELTNLAPTAIACQVVELFVAVATQAGPELTTESFAAAMETIGELTVTGVTDGSLGPGKPDLTDTIASIGFYDPETDLFS